MIATHPHLQDLFAAQGQNGARLDEDRVTTIARLPLQQGLKRWQQHHPRLLAPAALLGRADKLEPAHAVRLRELPQTALLLNHARQLFQAGNDKRLFAVGNQRVRLLLHLPRESPNARGSAGQARPRLLFGPEQRHRVRHSPLRRGMHGHRGAPPRAPPLRGGSRRGGPMARGRGGPRGRGERRPRGGRTHTCARDPPHCSRCWQWPLRAGGRRSTGHDRDRGGSRR
mmetsp:Transcript_65433/g.181573  ORF Transcript_65433/g.181573 Transcript_65433/m.181573 type:complete len:227 (+) Transcript_65433:129-809(+)